MCDEFLDEIMLKSAYTVRDVVVAYASVPDEYIDEFLDDLEEGILTPNDDSSCTDGYNRRAAALDNCDDGELHHLYHAFAEYLAEADRPPNVDSDCSDY